MSAACRVPRPVSLARGTRDTAPHGAILIATIHCRWGCSANAGLRGNGQPQRPDPGNAGGGKRAAAIVDLPPRGRCPRRIPMSEVRRADRTPTNATEFQFEFPSSRKIHVPGTLHPDVHVAMREVSLTPTRRGNVSEPNGPLRIYDTSGPYSDPRAAIDIESGD